MDRIMRFAFVMLILLAVIALSTQCFAQTPIRKLGRGVANIFTSPFEIPKSIQRELYDNGPAAAVTYGIFDGIYKFAMRAVVGVYEGATFVLPFPTDYEPIVEPEFLFSPDEPYSFED